MKSVLCFGDSNTWGYVPGSASRRYEYSERWTGILADALKPKARVIEEGLNGRTTVWSDGFRRGRNGQKMIAPILESHAPIDLLLMMLGTNDLKDRFCASPAMIARGLESLVEIASRMSCGSNYGELKMIILCPPPIVDLPSDPYYDFREGVEKSKKLAGLYEELALRLNLGFFDVGSCVQCSPIDGVHWEVEMHRALAEALIPICEEQLIRPSTKINVACGRRNI